MTGSRDRNQDDTAISHQGSGATSVSPSPSEREERKLAEEGEGGLTPKRSFLSLFLSRFPCVAGDSLSSFLLSLSSFFRGLD